MINGFIKLVSKDKRNIAIVATNVRTVPLKTQMIHELPFTKEPTIKI